MSYDALRKQVHSLFDLIEPQIEGVNKGLTAAISDEKLRKIRRVIISGAGDSYMAAVVSVDAFKKYAGVFGNTFEALPAIDVSRYFDFSSLQEPESVLVIGVSASGGPARVQELLNRAQYFGCETMAVTNNPESRVAKAAKHVFCVHTPVMENANPGLRNYLASMTALMTLAAHMGTVKGISNDCENLQRMMVDLVMEYQTRIQTIDKEMHTLANKWADAMGFYTIGDHLEKITAWFTAAKIIEVKGAYASTTDSEEWCHIEFFTNKPEKTPVIVIANSISNSISRTMETVGQIQENGNPCLLVIDETRKLEIPSGIDVCFIPRIREEYELLYPFVSFIPGSILASYLSEVTEEPYFRAPDFLGSTGTIQNSNIEIVRD